MGVGLLNFQHTIAFEWGKVEELGKAQQLAWRHGICAAYGIVRIAEAERTTPAVHGAERRITAPSKSPGEAICQNAHLTLHHQHALRRCRHTLQHNMQINTLNSLSLLRQLRDRRAPGLGGNCGNELEGEPGSIIEGSVHRWIAM